MTPIMSNDTHALILERVKNKTWLELVNRASGNVQILMFQSKSKAMEFIKGVSIERLIEIYQRMNVETVPMYKKGVI